MIDLEKLPLKYRIAIAIGVVLLTVLFLLFFPGASAERPHQIVPTKYDARIIELEKEALEDAYKRHIIRLFDIWVTDYRPDASEPPRAVKGAINGRAAYARAMEGIEKREKALRQ
jgi:hypothetical protein